jgi:hypothetical protein
MLQLRFALCFLRNILQHLHIREVIGSISSEIEKMDYYRDKNRGKADKKKRLCKLH